MPGSGTKCRTSSRASALSEAVFTDSNFSADRELAQRIALQDGEAFALLMRRHNRMLYRAARSVLKDEQEVEDAVQEAYLRAYRTIGQFRGEAKLSTWLVRIVLNEAFASSRTRSRGLKLALRLDHDPEETRWPEAPEEGAQRAQARRILQAKIDALPDQLRVVFTLRALNEMSVEEVAAALGIPKALVSLRYFRARRLLRAALAGTDGMALATLYPFAGSRCAGIVARVLVAASLRRVA